MSLAHKPRVAYLDGERLSRALRAGIHKLLADRIRLNRINVFPVPDGDTGTNMALTCSSIVSVLKAHPTQDAGALLMLIADAALDGARGNSGAILAQFFQGLADSFAGQARIFPDGLVRAFETADRYARAALDSPQEGTILSVITAVATALRARYDAGGNDLTELVDAGLAAAHTSLEETRNGLEAMRRAGVVDAGAGGFVDLMEGIGEFLHHGSLRAVPEPVIDEPDIAAAVMVSETAGEIEFRYCTECMITGDGIDRRKIRELLSVLGNSMVLAGTKRKLKVHIHTDDPECVFEHAGRFGEVTGRKADDMRQQTRTIGRSRERAVIVTDSAADMPESAYENLGIHVVPLRINFGERSYLDKISLTSEEFFAELSSNPEPARTSQPAPGDFRRTFEFLASHFEHVIVISLTDKLSGTYQAAMSAAARIEGPGSITVIDSCNVSLGQGLIAMYAAECAREGYDADRVTTAVHDVMPQTHTWGIVSDLTYAVRGGRLSPSRKRLADLFGVRPIFEVTSEGRIGTAGAVRRRANAAERLARFIGRRTDTAVTYRVVVGHGDCADDAEALQHLLSDALTLTEPVHVTELGSALGAHTGPGTLVAAVQDYRSP